MAYCLLGFLCAYFRYYHPMEFITAFLNNSANDDDLVNGAALAELYGVNVIPPKFGIARSGFFFDAETRTISKGVASVKYLNDSVAEGLYQIAHETHPKSFMRLIQDAKGVVPMNSRQLSTLIKIDYFSAFGNNVELLRLVDIYEFFKRGECRTIKKEKLNSLMDMFIKRHGTDRGKNGNELKSYTITDMDGLLLEIEQYIMELDLPELSYRIKAQNQKEILGYVDLTTNKEEDRRKLYVLEKYALQNKFRGGVWKYKLKTKSVGSGKVASFDVSPKLIEKTPVRAGDVIYASRVGKDDKGYWNLYQYEMVVEE